MSIDLRYLTWSFSRNSSGTAGTVLKAYDPSVTPKLYYKMSSYDSYTGVFGHESVNEYIVDRVLNLLGFAHLSYDLLDAIVNIDGRELRTYLCASKDFKRPGESKIALDAFYDRYKYEGESPLNFCLRQGWGSYIYHMTILDFLIINRDRHGANIEVLRGDSCRLAPLFDHGLSLLCSCRTEQDVAAFDPMADRPVQSFTGSRSLFSNLQQIPPEDRMRLPKLDRDYILGGLTGVLPGVWLDKIWEILDTRWRYYDDFCNQG